MKQHHLSCVLAIAALICSTYSRTFSQTDWHITGNAGTNAATNFVGTTDNQALSFRTNNANRMRISASGSVGIGTISPLQKLDVNGNINMGKGFSLFVENHRVLRIDSINANIFLGNATGALNTTGFFNTVSGYQAFAVNKTGNYNTAYGTRALASNTGSGNVANGAYALYSNNTGGKNTATGFEALYKNTAGGLNSANGSFALYSNIAGNFNVANGAYALYNTNASLNTAIGYSALYANSSGEANCAVGGFALHNNTSAGYNTAVGYTALYKNTTGFYNTAHGFAALYTNSTGSYNTATGVNALANNNANENDAHGAYALHWNTSGIQNSAMGTYALFANSTGSYNTGVGYLALYNTSASSYNTAVGYHSGDSYNNGWNNVFVGANADVNGTDYYNAVAIGESALCTGVSQARIGNSATNSIGGYANWTNISDVRVKKNIKENVPGLAFINKLKPITYNLDLDAADKITQPPAKKDKDGKLAVPSQLEINARMAKQQVLYTGFAAQDVEKAAKELNYDFSGVDAAKNSKDLYGLRYSDFVVPLVKAVQELSQKVEKLEAALAQKNSGNVSSLSSKNVTVTDASLGQNAPNPFTHSTSINYTVPQKFSSAQIIIHDNDGRTIKQINISAAGKGAINVDASMLSAGTYSYSLIVDGKPISSKQMILTK